MLIFYHIKYLVQGILLYMKKPTSPEHDITLLTVPQVILLCLLIATVTSVVTAIVVAQLTFRVPGDTIFQTVDRVTETVVRENENANTGTVIIKEGDLVARAINSVSGTSEQLFTQTSEGEIINLAAGYKINDSELISPIVSDVVGSVSAGFAPVGYFGSEDIMLWKIIGDDTFSLPHVQFDQGNPQIGQTLIFVSADGKIVKGLVQGISDTQLEFSENISIHDSGLLLEVGGKVIGFWNGSTIIRSNAIDAQLQSLRQNDLITDTNQNVIDNTQTNPDDVTTDEKQAGCLLFEGTFNEYSECLGIDQGQCLSLGGQFNECASACRHDDNAEICTMQCVVTCQL